MATIVSNYTALAVFITCFLHGQAQTIEGSEGHVALDEFPLIDGHNDVPHNLYLKLRNQIEHFHFDKDLSNDSTFGLKACPTCHTDLVRLKKGKVGAQFWSAYVSCNPEHKGTIVSRSLEQIDVIKRLVDKYPHQMELVTTADGIEDAFLRKRLASLIGLEGGHSIDNKMALLRLFYEMGVRYMTLTHTCNLPWVDSSTVDNEGNFPINDLTEFGKKIVREMNRLGMMVDLSHVSYNVMRQAIEVSKAPVIFSHSSAYAIHPHPRNVRDDILHKIKEKDGIVMVNFYKHFIGEGYVTIYDVMKHIDHIVDVAGIDHVGIGGDFDGVESMPEGLHDVSTYPRLFDILKETNETRWTLENLQKLAGRNLYRVFKKVEQVKIELSKLEPDESLIPDDDLARARLFEPSGASKTTTNVIVPVCVLLFMFM